MARTPSLRSPLAAALALAGALGGCGPTTVMWWLLGPSDDFTDEAAPPAPDYSQQSAWASRPDMADNADRTPEGLVDHQGDAAADVFFIHPTTFYPGSGWNADLHHPVAQEVLDEAVLSEVVSVFNGCCRVWAPRYRQATVAAFFATPKESEPAMQLAYSDVKAAYQYFIQHLNQGRPFIIAGHSQGSLHAQRLLEEIDKRPERDRLVAAYIPGYRLWEDRFGSDYTQLVPCARAEQTGCIASWDSYTDEAEVSPTDKFFFWNHGHLESGVAHPTSCVNPISWQRDRQATTAEAHKGAVEVTWETRPPGGFDLLRADEATGMKSSGVTAVQPGLVTAQCVDGILRISKPPTPSLARKIMAGQEGNYHLLDFNLYYADVRENARLRVKAWQDTHAPAPKPAPAQTGAGEGDGRSP